MSAYDTHILLTPDGEMRTRTIKACTEGSAWDEAFLLTVKGKPWNPKAVPERDTLGR